MKKRHLFIFAVTALTALCTLVQQAYAVKAFPGRLVIYPGDRTAELKLKNISDTPREYRFSWRHISMTKDGKVALIKKHGPVEGYKPADGYLRYSPRRMIVQPGAVQTLRFLVRRSDDMVDGEYRSHLVVEEAPYKEPDIAKDSPVIQQGVQLLPGRAIPIHLMHGDVAGNVELVRSGFLTDRTGVEFTLKHTGNRSVFADAYIYCDSGGDREILKRGDAIIYQEADKRDFNMPLKKPVDHCETVTLEIKGSTHDPRKGEIYASTVLQ